MMAEESKTSTIVSCDNNSKPVIANSNVLEETTEDNALLNREKFSTPPQIEAEAEPLQPKPHVSPLSVQEKPPRKRRSTMFHSTLFPIYLSHALSCWGDRMWAFTMGMLLVDWEHLQSLRTVAIHQLCQAGAVFIFGALIGSWVDRTKRLRATVNSIVAQNIFVCASAIVMLVLLKLTENERGKDAAVPWQHHLAIGLAIAFSTLAHLASVACQLTVVKDWVPTLCREDREKLTSTNATLKRIDLMTATLSPVLAGAAMDLFSPWAGGIVIVIWNLISAPAEIALLCAVYRKNVLLQLPKTSASSANRTDGSANKQLCDCFGTTPLVMKPAVMLIRGWDTYWHQIVRWSGASLSALYFTGSSVFGLVGTVVFPHIRKSFGLRRGGAIFYVGHAIILAIAVFSIFLPGSPFGPIAIKQLPNNDSNNTAILPSILVTNLTTTIMPSLGEYSYNQSNSSNITITNESDCLPNDHIGGLRMPHLCILTAAVILSRLTLWGTDLSINQGLVERVAAKERGAVNGVQNSLNQLVDLIRLISVICVPYPSQFGYLVIATFVWIAAGAILYIVGSPQDESSVTNNQQQQKRT